jgi:hypothetical protein
MVNNFRVTPDFLLVNLGTPVPPPSTVVGIRVFSILRNPTDGETTRRTPRARQQRSPRHGAQVRPPTPRPAHARPRQTRGPRAAPDSPDTHGVAAPSGAKAATPPTPRHPDPRFQSYPGRGGCLGPRASLETAPGAGTLLPAAGLAAPRRRRSPGNRGGDTKTGSRRA